MPSDDAKLADATPKSQAINISLGFPDDHPREITKVEYISDGQPILGAPMAALIGTYRISAQVNIHYACAR